MGQDKKLRQEVDPSVISTGIMRSHLSRFKDGTNQRFSMFISTFCICKHWPRMLSSVSRFISAGIHRHKSDQDHSSLCCIAIGRMVLSRHRTGKETSSHFIRSSGKRNYKVMLRKSFSSQHMLMHGSRKLQVKAGNRSNCRRVKRQLVFPGTIFTMDAIGIPYQLRY